jgi:radical SAM protein with 4Fe4S-binding SPASM domain
VSEERDSLFEGSKSFCMIPWIHLHIWPDGTAYPCCFFDMKQPIGSLRANSLTELWNSDGIRQLRLTMLEDKPSEGCTRCYELERAGSPSLRKNMNRGFAHHRDKVRSTQADGGVETLNLPYFDVRFSNLCNFRCRTCGPGLSSSWHEEGGDLSKPRLLQPTENPADLWRQIEPLVPAIEQIYFAGGEPLITDEHYDILKRFIALGRTGVRIRYNTNFSQMVFRGEDVRQLWNHFEDVSVGASLDAMGSRAEYLRKGTHWEVIERNRREMLAICPGVRFHISATVSVLNVLHFPAFHRAWVEQGLVGPNDLHLNLLTFPQHYRVQILPPVFKEQIRSVYQEHIDGFLAGLGAEQATNAFRSVLQFMDEADLQSELATFRETTRRLDDSRGEHLADVFPELAPLL